MKHSVSAKPYTEYWMNCVLSLMVSLVSSYSPQCADAAVMNHYEYINFGNSIWWKLLEVQYSPDFYKELSSRIELRPLDKIEEDELVPMIKSYVDSDRLLMLTTDAYHLIKNSLHYHSTHMPHGWLFNGYDDQTGSFYIFSDNIGGFGENEVTAQDFELAIIPETYTQAYELVLDRREFAYRLTLDEVRTNAAKINKSIAKLSDCNFWKCHSVEYTEDRCFDMSKLIGRQHANAVLFARLCECGLIDEALRREMTERSGALELGWSSVRGIFLKRHIKGRVPDYAALSKKAWDLLCREYDMWTYFLEMTENR